MTECPWAYMHVRVLLPSASFPPQVNFRMVKGWHKLFQIATEDGERNQVINSLPLLRSVCGWMENEG